MAILSGIGGSSMGSGEGMGGMLTAEELSKHQVSKNCGKVQTAD